MKIYIAAEQMRKRAKKMSYDELQEHLKNSRQGVGIQKSKKQYSRKEKYKTKY